MRGKELARTCITHATAHLAPLPAAPTVPDEADPWLRVVEPQAARHLGLDEVTIAEALRGAGYRTYFLGKWHLGREPEVLPEHQGFNVNLGGGRYAGPSGGYFDPYNNDHLPIRVAGEYLTGRLTEEALGFIEASGDRPFFLFLWHYGVHGPWEAKQSLVDAYARKVDPRGKQDCPVMAAMIHSVDESLGRIMDKLDQLDIADHTILIFMSDNGGNPSTDLSPTCPGFPTSNEPLRGAKGNSWEGSYRRARRASPSSRTLAGGILSPDIGN
jgi:arylsulfatase A-like enzyme